MPIHKLKRFLDDHKVRYVTMHHSPAYTAQEVAQTTHISGKELAKVVMLKLDENMAMAVIPACQRVKLEALAKTAGAIDAELAEEREFAELFTGCEVGAMPPFGNLWDIPVYVSTSLAEDEQIGFAAGTHYEVLKLAFDDFRRLVEPVIGDFAA
jgi:Ala-tRNA(Pro) deacylase